MNTATTTTGPNLGITPGYPYWDGRHHCCGHHCCGCCCQPVRVTLICTCPMVWHATIPPPPCPVHGQPQWITVTC